MFQTSFIFHILVNCLDPLNQFPGRYSSLALASLLLAGPPASQPRASVVNDNNNDNDNVIA